MFEAGLHDLLETNKASIAGASFWPGELPQNQTGACGTYMRAGGPADPTFDTEGLKQRRYQFDCYGDTALQAMSVRDGLSGFMLGAGQSTLTDGTRFQGALLVDEPIGPLFDQDRRKFYCMVELYLYSN